MSFTSLFRKSVLAVATCGLAASLSAQTNEKKGKETPDQEQTVVPAQATVAEENHLKVTSPALLPKLREKTWIKVEPGYLSTAVPDRAGFTSAQRYGASPAVVTLKFGRN